ncbi:MAG TPA: hypothetical protein VNX88_14575 [Terriglobales bacterium]|nr:hypothetical protein [Terriglobales bacterium]
MLRAKTGKAARFFTIVFFITTVLPAGAAVKGDRGRNGQHARPFYIVAHNPNEISDVDAVLAAGANALEPDVMRFSDATVVGPADTDHVNTHAGASGLFMYHDHVVITTRLPTTVEDYFDYVHHLIADIGVNISLITLDIKSAAASSGLVLNLQNAVHTHLNHDGVRVNVIYSVGSTSDIGALFALGGRLDDNEGVQVDGESGPDAAGTVFNDFLDSHFDHISFGDGGFGVSLGLNDPLLPFVDSLSPGVVPSIDFASWFRAGGFGGFWDLGQYLNGGPGKGFAIPYAYPIPVDTPPNIGYVAFAFMDEVDGLIADSDEQPQILSDTVASVRNLRNYIDNYDPDHYVATAADNPFYIPPEAYAIQAKTTSGLSDGTSDTIRFDLTGECGTSTVFVEGDFDHRFHRNDPTHSADTYITIPSKNLGKLRSLRLSSGGSNTWRVGQIHIASTRWGIPYDNNLIVDLGAGDVDSDDTQTVDLGSTFGYTCDITPPHASPSQTPAKNSFGWNNDPQITVNWNWTDNPGGTGIRPVACQSQPSYASQEGSYDLPSKCQDVEGNDAVAAYRVQIDRTPPAFQCAAPDGKWHANDVSLLCSGSDSLSGLASAADASFSLSTSLPPNTETADAPTGIHTFSDKAGNSTQAGPIFGNKIDKKPPVITINQPAATSYTHADTLVLNYNVVDGGSGVASVLPTMNGSTTVAGNVLSNGLAIPLLTSLPLGPNTFKIDSADMVGNNSSSSVTFNIIVTPQSIMQDIVQLQGNGLNQPGGSLMAKLGNAAANFGGSNCHVAANQYSAFIHEVQAQTGKSIMPTASAILIGDAQYLISHCQ